MAKFLRELCVLSLYLNCVGSHGSWSTEKQKSQVFLLLHSDVPALQSNITSQKKVTTSMDCAHQCLADQHCKAFNFRKSSKGINCQLTNTLEHNFEKSGEQSSTRWMFYQAAPKRQISDATATACANKGKVVVSNGTLRGKDLSSASTILSGEPLTFITHLESWLPAQARGGSWSVCWRASRDGWSAATFHAGCDDKGPTLTVVKVATYIFGGYTEASWKPGVRGFTEHKPAPESFLYSLRNTDDLAPFKAPLLDDEDDEDDEVAITAAENSGPRFGFFSDLEISNNANTNIDSSTKGFGRSYQAPDGYLYLRDDTVSLLAGTKYFSPSEIEVFNLHLYE